ncbi:MAG: response regulator [Melioribacteraceae bacterium]|nr:response regulator [Melioribacteraceae bacterium]MCF8263785.1 response regulator [Melioribacteraceae bacterium]MCF8430782.1 response regulator [Melioribacteraceae bacterium]
MTPKSKKPSLLIVEDDYESQRFLQIFLSKTFDLDICDSSEPFYKLLENKNYAMILMDISLKGKKDGLMLTREIRDADKPYSDIPIACLTAHAFQRDKENAMNAGVDIFMTKPVENNHLLLTLKSLLSDKEGIEI